MKIRSYEERCPYCGICGERITDDEYLTDGREYYHHPRYKDCLEVKQTDTYVENERMRQDVYEREY